MTAAEKTELFNFLSSAEDFLSGYRVQRADPAFTDSTDTGEPAPVAPSGRESFDNSGYPDSMPPDQETPCLREPHGFDSMEDVARAVCACTDCPLAAGRISAVPGEGASGPGLIMVIGEGPGADEDSSGKPFVGKAGQLLDKMLSAISLSRNENCFIANIVKCRPPNNREPLPEESAACRRYLDAQIRLVKPVMILALGRTAAQNLLQTGEGIGSLHGQFFDWNGITLMPTYHPSALLRDDTLKRPVWEDLKKFRAEFDRIRIH
jgi:DNA polymerase